MICSPGTGYDDWRVLGASLLKSQPRGTKSQSGGLRSQPKLPECQPKLAGGKSKRPEASNGIKRARHCLSH